MRTERIEARLESDHADRIRYAARLARTSMSSFVVDAATEEAERVIAQHSETVVPSDFFDALLSALDDPSPAPVDSLRRAAKHARRSIKRP